MVKLGATSTWEYFLPAWTATLKPGQQPPPVSDPKVANFEVSLCHPWSSGATAWLTDHVLGVTPYAPGFASVMVRPFVGDLMWARGTVPTPRGPVSVSWGRSGRQFRLSCVGPVGVKEIHIAPPSGKRYLVNGRAARPTRSGRPEFILRGRRAEVVVER
jgi:hypothetical protein